MGILQIISHRPQAGKTSLASVLLLALAQADKPAGYYKPFSTQPATDPDIAFIQAEILNPQGGPPAPPSSILEPSSTMSESQAHQLNEAVTTLQASQPRILVEGPDLESVGQASTLAVEVASLLDSRVVLIYCFSKDLDPAGISQDSAAFGDRLAGVVVNCVTKHRMPEVRQAMSAELASRGIPFLGVVPELRIMHAPTVAQVAENLGGHWIQEPTQTGQPLERFLIGGNIMDSGPEYYGRYENQAVITRSQRPDIQLASLVAGTKCLVLTEGGEPTEYIKAEARERGVPVMVVQAKTLEAVEALAPLFNSSRTHNLASIQGFALQLKQYLDLEHLASLAL
ncbi:MAG: hypothetical protein BZY88_13665 [SAR202 cluster bacterium Io17-Chloro-G9]|nr:MAG: hypothetical protein BZY88_13665 [SAR202 cluster bacterium Io17-Chloro-G9]